MTADEKTQTYRDALQEITAVLEGEDDRVAQMATVACLLSERFGERFFWTGFYVVDPSKPDELVVGPYQGSLGCLRIAFGRGVCGTAAATGETQIVDDVHAIENHIACDVRSVSEIVCPVRDASGALIAVLDIDSTQPAAFDSTDKAGLEAVVDAVFAAGRGE